MSVLGMVLVAGMAGAVGVAGMSGCVAVSSRRYGPDHEVFVVRDRAYVLDKSDGRIKELDLSVATPYVASDESSDADD